MTKISEAEKAYTSKKYQLSIDLYRIAVQEEPDNPFVYQGLAQSLLWAKAYNEAILTSTKALELASDLFLPYVVRAYSHFAKKDLDAFRIDAKKAYELNPQCAEVLTCYGTMLLVDRNLDSSIETFNKALQIDPSDMVAYNNIILAFSQKGDAKNAYNYTKMMYSISPSIKTGIKLISAFHQTYPYLFGIAFILLILLAIILHTNYILALPLLYVIYGFWLSSRLMFLSHWKSGLGMFCYAGLMLILLYIIYNSI